MSFKWGPYPELRKALTINNQKALRALLPLPRGWDGWGSLPMDRGSLKSANAFFSNAKLGILDSAQVSLTRRGHLCIIWDDSEGFAVELEFTSGTVEYYFEATEEDGAVWPRSAQDFVEHMPK